MQRFDRVCKSMDDGLEESDGSDHGVTVSVDEEIY